MVDYIIGEFNRMLGMSWIPPGEQYDIAADICALAMENGISRPTDTVLAQSLYEAINQKLNLNRSAIGNVFDICGVHKVRLDYHDKLAVSYAFNSANYPEFAQFMTMLHLPKMALDAVLSSFPQFEPESTINSLKEFLRDNPQNDEITYAIFARYFYFCFPSDIMQKFFMNSSMERGASYFDYVYALYPDLKLRNPGLSILHITDGCFSTSYEDGCNRILAAVAQSFSELSNHSYLCVLLPQIRVDGSDCQWRAYSDIILFAEKHISHRLDKGYFRWERIRSDTGRHIQNMDLSAADFETVHEGFVFKDCFCIEVDNSASSYVLLMTFEKNIRDERPLPCPACNSLDIEGNSYPILNVRSWECKNPVCPERSLFNRGNRYSYCSLHRQESNRTPKNHIDYEKIKKWKLDCLRVADYDEIYEMIVSFYSLHDDAVNAYGDFPLSASVCGRKIRRKKLPNEGVDYLGDFHNSSYFKRYMVDNDRAGSPDGCHECTCVALNSNAKAAVVCGDSQQYLRKIDGASIDCAVTSPPYYNAKSYAQWPNIYCYLYDMYALNKEVYRVLKDGSVYLFNIFDYFDNEKNIVQSAMGKKRMILGAYIIDMFLKIGFRLNGNIIWNKNEINGKRHFNQGNDVPYYQAPLNCWEHILIFSKGAMNSKYALESSIVDIKPVIKMIKGINTHGHEAPFPEEIPELIVSKMDVNETVLDPFAGSCTTAVVAGKFGINSINIDYNREYCDLGVRRLRERFNGSEE